MKHKDLQKLAELLIQYHHEEFGYSDDDKSVVVAQTIDLVADSLENKDYEN